MQRNTISGLPRLTGVSAIVSLLLLTAGLFTLTACSSPSEDAVDPTAIVSQTSSVRPTSGPSTPTATTVPRTQAPTSPTETPSTIEVTPLSVSTPSPLSGEFFLNLIEPSDLDVFATSSTFEVAGQTRIDAVVTVNDDSVTPYIDGMFTHTVQLEDGINVVEVVGSVSSQEQNGYVITVVYLP